MYKNRCFGTKVEFLSGVLMTFVVPVFTLCSAGDFREVCEIPLVILFSVLIRGDALSGCKSTIFVGK